MSKFLVALLIVLISLSAQAEDSAGQNLFGFHAALAKEGNPDSMYMLGNLYERGVGVNKDYEKALRWYRMASEHGNLIANRKIANLNKKIEALKQNPLKPPAKNHPLAKLPEDNKKSSTAPKPMLPQPVPQKAAPSLAIKSESNKPEPNKPESNKPESKKSPTVVTKTKQTRLPESGAVAAPPAQALDKNLSTPVTVERNAVVTDQSLRSVVKINLSPNQQDASLASKTDASLNGANKDTPPNPVSNAPDRERSGKAAPASNNNRISGTTVRPTIVNSVKEVAKKAKSSGDSAALASNNDATSAGKNNEATDQSQNEFNANPCNGPSARFMSTCR